MSDFYLDPVSEETPCGGDIRWDADVIALSGKFSRLLAGDDAQSIVSSGTPEGAQVTSAELVRETAAMLMRSKNIEIASVHAIARWMDEGLEGFADAFEGVVTMVSKWPDPRTGIYPRADEDDDTDFDERRAAFGKGLRVAPTVAASHGWGRTEGTQARTRTVQRLEAIMANWRESTAPALGGDAVRLDEFWRAIRAIEGYGEIRARRGQDADVDEDAADPESEEHGATDSAPGAEPSARKKRELWDLVAEAAERMANEQPHSPAAVLLSLAMAIRDKSLIEIAQAMKASGVTLEQFLEAARKIEAPNGAGATPN